MGLRTLFMPFFLLFWFLLLLVLLSFIWLSLVYLLTKLELKRHMAPKVTEDESLQIEVEIKNRSLFPAFNVILEDHLSCAWPWERQKFILTEYLPARYSESFTFNCVCPQRGLYRVGPFNVYFFDFFGLFFLKKTYQVYSQVYVYPYAFNIRKFPPLTKGAVPWFGIETARVSGDEDEFYGVRDYKRGDPIKKIHWISSARKNQLIVKQFQRQSFFRGTIMFNLEKDNNFGEGKECVAEYKIKIVASVAKYLINLGVSVEIIAHTEEIIHIPSNRGQEHLEDIFKFLAVAKAESSVSLLEVFINFNRYIAEDSTLITVMLDTDREYIPAMLSSQVRNVSLLPIILVSSSFLGDWESKKTADTFDIKIPEMISLRPIYICCGEIWEDKF
jgi:uncharacterized protein (DUF58 family)